MAENAVSFVIKTLGDLLIQKIVFLQGAEEQVSRLRDELVRIRCFLKDADRKQDQDDRIRNWVSEMRAVSYDAEDVIEIFVTKMESIKRKPILEKIFYFPMRMHCLNKVGKEIESIQSRITDISNSREKFGIGNLGEGPDVSAEELQCLRRTSANTEDKNIVDIEEKTILLVSELLKEDRRRRVLSITGMGGVGKTTLARRVYNHADVKAQFSCRAWVCVSERYNFMEIMKTIILQVDSISNEQLNKFEVQEAALKERLSKCLQGKRYLVVLDDIWQETGWDCLDGILPDEGGNGSRLLLTSRKKSVPLHADPLRIPYELKPLGQEESWMLFVKAFADSPNGSFPSDLEEIGRKIVSKCEGLPLAIAIIGRLLLQKNRLSIEWESVFENISSHLSEEERILPILELSYRDLTPNLKFCFNYLGFFPEDYEISVQKLTLMWIAEGIIPKSDDANCLEKIAADCMKQLINRNMVQVAEITIDERVKSCRLHDLLRELAIRKAKDENFQQIHGNRRGNDETSLNPRYLSVSCPPQETFSGFATPRLRTLLFFNMGRHVAFDKFSFIGFIVLRVLHLEDTRINWLPKEIGEISLLRYLGLRGTDIKRLPGSLGRLQRLQTLDVFNRLEVQIPNVISKFECLRHLYLNDSSTSAPIKIEGLKNLHTLSRIHCDHLMRNNLMTLTSLQKLGIWIDSNSDIDQLCTTLSKLENLRCLNLYASYGFPISMDGISNISHLSDLKLSGELKMLPPLFPSNLSRLSLISTRLTKDPMPTLANLEHLSFLKLDDAYSGKEMTISRNGFSQLNFLEFRMLHDFEVVKVEKHALPKLYSLRIKDCYSLKMLPVELTSIAALQKLELVNMPKNFVSRLEGLDPYKVCQVPTVRIFDKVERPPFDYYRSRNREHRASVKMNR